MPFKNEEAGGKIKPAGYGTAYTNEQYYELMIRCPDDPVYFIQNYCWIVSTKVAGGRTRFNLYEYQKLLVKHYKDYRKSITLLARQVGKCFFSTTLLYIDGKSLPIWSLVDKTWKHHAVRTLERLLIALARYAKNV